MPKKFLKKILPHPDKIKHHKSLKIFGPVLHSPNYWHMNRRSISRAFAVGLFTCFIPLPFQMIIAAGIGLLVRANILLSVALVWISNPLTIPPMFYFAYKVGTWVLRIPPRKFHIELSVQWVTEQLHLIWKPLILGSLICGLVSALLGYLIIRIIWRIWIVQHLAERKKRHCTRNDK